MKHYLDVCGVHGYDVKPVDLITFGSPCQDLSVAGHQKGILHAEKGDDVTTRSGLFYEAIRIIKEMREVTNGQQPKYAIWENVTGAFSSNRGEDFRSVLLEFCRICDPTLDTIPKPKKWEKVGQIVGDGYSVAWRTLDAQYFPRTPQRRKRIYLVADFTSQRATQILFECQSLPRDTTQSEEPRETAAATVGNGTPSDDRVVGIDLYNQCETGGVSQTIRAKATDSEHIPCVAVGCDLYNQDLTGEVAHAIRAFATGSKNAVIEPVASAWDGTQVMPTLTARNAGGNQRMPDKENFECVIEPITYDGKPTVATIDAHYGLGAGMRGGVERPIIAVPIENHPNDSRVKVDESGTIQTQTSRMGTGGGNVPLIMEKIDG